MTSGGWRAAPSAAAVVCAAAILWLAVPSVGWAHPHVWIDSVVEMMFDQANALTGVRVYWVFDEFYSAFAVEGLDEDGDGTISPAELRPLVAQNIKELKDFGYFTYVEADGKPQPYDDVTEYGMHHINGRLAMWFLVPLAKPVDPRTAKVSVTTYDPTFYIAIDPAPENPVRIHGAMPPACTYAVSAPPDSTDNPQYSENFFQGLDGSEGVGARFASWVRLSCGPSS